MMFKKWAAEESSKELGREFDDVRVLNYNL